MKNKGAARMLPIGALMIEHRLIERMVYLLKRETARIEAGGSINPDFISITIDFFRSYADRCHHGKEEDILFKDLDARKLSGEHRQIMSELLQDHADARALVRQLDDAKEKYLKKDTGAIKGIKEYSKRLVELYIAHIEKEDKKFFIPSMIYFTKQEQDDMLNRFWDFDRGLIHEKYKKILDYLDKGEKQ